MNLFILYLLTTCDGACSGIRAASGRDARIDKRRYFAVALFRGALAAQVVACGMAALVLGWEAVSGWRGEVVFGLEAAAGWVLQIYLPFAFVLLTAMVVRLVPSVDVRSLTSVTVFGPLTFLRPTVAILGVAWALGHGAGWPVALVALGTLVVMLRMEHQLGREVAPA